MPVTVKIFSWSEVLTWEEFWEWSEVWALLIPLAVLGFSKKKFDTKLKPVVVYLWTAFVLISLADFTYRFQIRLDLPKWTHNNTVLYNLHSVARFFLFAWFFERLQQPFLTSIKKIVPYLFLAFILVYFLLLGPLNRFYTAFSSTLYATESALLLLYCLQYYIYLSKREEIISAKERSINWITAGLTIYVAFNFFIFLFFSMLAERAVSIANILWQVHNGCYILFCCFIAKGFYDQRAS